MSAVIAKADESILDPAVIESLVVKGDLSLLSPLQKVAYYNHLCARLGLDPATQPFAFMKLNNKEIAYALKACTDQLRKIHAITIVITSAKFDSDLYVVTARATYADGRGDEDVGAVAVGNLKGEALANAMMKATTKAKRRVTLSICGLGMLDESELDTIPQSRMEAIPQEMPRGEVIVQGEPTTTLRAVRPPKVEAGAAPLTSKDKAPQWFEGVPPLKWLAGQRFCDMDEDGLECVAEHGPRARGQWAQMTGVDPNKLRQLHEAEVIACELLDERHGAS